MKINNTNIKVKDILEISKIISSNSAIVSEDYHFIITLKSGKHLISKNFNTYLECEKEILKLEKKIKQRKIFKKIIKAFLQSIAQILIAISIFIILVFIIKIISSSVVACVIIFSIIIIGFLTLNNYVDKN